MKEAAAEILCVVGTRPEAIKMAPVVLALRRAGRLGVRILATGQHTDMLRQALEDFGLVADVDLDVMRQRQSLDYVTASVLEGTGRALDERRPEVLLVHGDTTTTFAASLAAFYRRIPVGHVEAGLRSGDLHLPFPEEMNRLLTDRISSFCFAPTEGARKNLLREGIPSERIWVTGNTVIDALRWTLGRGRPPKAAPLARIPREAPLLLVTAHRRESWGAPMARIASAVARLREEAPRHWIVVPMHKNPAVREILMGGLQGLDRVILCEPLDYPDFVWAMERSELILSDSGGVQEEASSIRKPVLILRDVTERPEALERGTGVLVGTEEGRILSQARRVLFDPEFRARLIARSDSPFGDGRAGERIEAVLAEALGVGGKEEAGSCPNE